MTAQRLLKTDLQAGGYKQTMLGFSFQLAVFPRDGQVPIATVARRSGVLPPAPTRVSVSQLFVNDVHINASNMLSGNGVIHGLSAVLSIVRNRCDQTEYHKFGVKSDGTADGTSD